MIRDIADDCYINRFICTAYDMKEAAPDFLLLGGDAVCREPRLYQLRVDLAGLAGPQ